MAPGYDAVPEELKSRPQWVCWAEEERGGNVTKIPKQPDGSGANAKSNDMATWGPFEDAVATAAERDGWGIGFMFSDADPFVGIDLDGCLRPGDRGRPEAWLPALSAFKETYIERSPSGGGLHVIVKETQIPDWWTNQVEHLEKNPDFFAGLDLNGNHDEVGVELYDHGRFFTFTGDVLESIGGDGVQAVDGLGEWLVAAYLVFHDELPFDDPDRDSDVDLSVYDVLSRSEYPEGERRAHPVHGSSTGANFMVDHGGETWRCWSGGHECTGDALHLVGMEEGLIDCGEWTNGGSIDSETWREVFDAARERGLIEDDDNGSESSSRSRSRATSTDDSDAGGDRGLAGGIDPPDDDFWQRVWEDYAAAEEAIDKQIVRRRVAKRLNRERPFAAHEESDTLYVYGPATGTYEPRGEQHAKRTLVDRLGHHYTRFERGEIIEQLRSMSYKRPEQFGGPAGVINVANGVLDLRTQALTEHQPEYMFLSSLPVEYDPREEAPRWESFLETAIPKRIDRMKVQEYIGYCLMHWDLSHHKALFIVGPTASGKSTFLDTVRALLGPDTVSSITPQELVDERFAAVELFGAWANIRNDIPAGVIENTGKFKELVAGDPIKAERKYEPTFTFEPKAKHLYSANQLPEASVDDEAFYRRILLVSFPSTVPINERDPDLPTKLEGELPGVLNWAVEGYERLVERGEFTGARSPGEVRSTWESWGSTIERFKQTCTEYVPDGRVPKSVCHKAYVRFCEEKGLPAADTQNQMTRKFKKDKDIDDGRATVGGKRVRCYLGIELKEAWDPRAQADARRTDNSLDQFGTETEG